MKRKIHLPVLTSICLLLLLAPPAAGQDSLTNISKIEIQPGALTTKLVLQTDALLPVQSAYYAPSAAPDPRHRRRQGEDRRGSPGSAGRIPADREYPGRENRGFGPEVLPAPEGEESPTGSLSESDRTVIELNRIQRAQAEYVIDPETDARLDKKPEARSILNKLDIAEQRRPDQLQGQARRRTPSPRSSPWTIPPASSSTSSTPPSPVPRPSIRSPSWASNKVRIGQFQMSDPGPITRMVFDLKEPGPYALETDKGDLVISFLKPGPRSPAPGPCAEPQNAAPAPVDAVEGRGRSRPRPPRPEKEAAPQAQKLGGARRQDPAGR